MFNCCRQVLPARTHLVDKQYKLARGQLLTTTERASA